MKCEELFQEFKEEGVEFFCGVPDSILNGFIEYVEEKGENMVTANEGGAVALAAGYHLATGKVPVVYMSNAGLGNCVNPLTSLTNREVYRIPMILLIGYRKGEVQHKKMGEVTVQLLEMLDIPHMVLNSLQIEGKAIPLVVKLAEETKRPIALIVKEAEAFDEYRQKEVEVGGLMTREEAIRIIVDSIDEEDVIVCTTGKASRELWEMNTKHPKFLNVGAMGHTSQIALGIAMSTKRQVWCIDGDGSILMHMGGLVVIANSGCKNLKYILLNNGRHDSVGGIKTANVSGVTDYCEVVEGCGIPHSYQAANKAQLEWLIGPFKRQEGPNFFEVLVKGGTRKELGRPTDLKGMKEELMRRL